MLLEPSSLTYDILGRNVIIPSPLTFLTLQDKVTDSFAETEITLVYPVEINVALSVVDVSLTPNKP